MNGRVKVFFEQKGYGFIAADDGHDYFFHLSSTSTSVKPYTGMSVVFTIEAGDKGPVAKNVHNIETPTKKSFIIIGDTRIKVSNIKVYELKDNTSVFIDSNGDVCFANHGKKLVIETFQGDTFSFDEFSGIDIFSKCNELDELLCN